MVNRICSIVLLGAILFSFGLAPVQSEASTPVPAASSVSTGIVDPRAPSPHPILSNVNIRRAIAYCTNKEALAAAAYPELPVDVLKSLVMDSFLPPEHWAYHQSAQQYPYNPAMGKALLDAEGWLEPEPGALRINEDGAQLAIFLHSTDADLRVRYLEQFAYQMMQCGIQVMPMYVNAAWLFSPSAGLWRRDFEMTAFAWVASENPLESLSELYRCEKIPSRHNNWSGQNYMGWCNPTASSALAQAEDPNLTQDQLKALLATVQNAFAEDVPSLPLFRRYSDAPPNLTSIWEHIDFNLEVVPPTVRPLSDIRVRQAIAHCTNKTELVKAGYPLLTDEQARQLVADSFIGKDHWAYNNQITRYPYNPATGKALLELAGWTLGEDAAIRANAAGDELSIKFTTTQAAFRQNWAAAFETQMADCGIRVVRQHVPASWWFSDQQGLQVRDFEMGAFAWVGQADPGGSTLWDCAQIPSPGNNWTGQNYMGWCNERATRAIRRATNSIDQNTRLYNYAVVQQEYTRDVPAIPLFNRSDHAAAVSSLTGLTPIPGEEYYTYNASQWAIPGKDTIRHGLTQDPGSLFTLQNSAFVAQVLAELVAPRPYTSLNFTFQPNWMKQLSRIENGLAQNQTVEAQTGDPVMDVAGNTVTLEPGVWVFDEAGNEVEYQGGVVRMKQLVVKYEARPDLKWQDGSLVSEADLRLGHKIACDPETGANSYRTCDLTQSITFSGLSYTVTWLPGYQDPLYFLAPFGFYPSKQPILSAGPYQGKRLADVPAREWGNLPEVNRTPWSYGPYKVTEWLASDRILLEANPYYFKGAAKTPKYVVQIMAWEDAENALITGQIDLLGWDTLAGLSEALALAEARGTVKTYVAPSATWEHIDFMIDPLPVDSPVTPEDAVVIEYQDPQGDPVTVEVPAGAVAEPVELIFIPQPVSANPLPVNQQPAGLSFTLAAFQNQQQLLNFTFLKPVTLSLSYSESDVAGLVEEELALKYWTGSQWADAAGTCTGDQYLLERDTASNTLRVNICHLTEFVLVSREQVFKLYLPTLNR